MAFKEAGDRPIDFRAVSQNPLNGDTSPIPSPTDGDVIRYVRRVVMAYASNSAGPLSRYLPCARRAMAFVVDKARTSMAFGMRIPDNVIVERFKYHKVSLGPEPKAIEIGEDEPFAA